MYLIILQCQIRLKLLSEERPIGFVCVCVCVCERERDTIGFEMYNICFIMITFFFFFLIVLIETQERKR